MVAADAATEAGRLIYSLVKNITSAPKQTNANAAIIPTAGDHRADRVTRASRAMRVRGIAYNSTTMGG